MREGFPGLFALVDSAGESSDIMAMLPDVTAFLTATPNSGECQDGHLAKFLSGGASPTECRFQSAFPEQFYQKCSSFGGTPIHASVKLRLGSKFNLQKTLEKIPDIAPYAGLIAMILGIGPGDIIDIRDAAAYCLPSACSDQGTQAIEKRHRRCSNLPRRTRTLRF